MTGAQAASGDRRSPGTETTLYMSTSYANIGAFAQPSPCLPQLTALQPLPGALPCHHPACPRQQRPPSMRYDDSGRPPFSSGDQSKRPRRRDDRDNYYGNNRQNKRPSQFFSSRPRPSRHRRGTQPKRSEPTPVIPTDQSPVSHPFPGDDPRVPIPPDLPPALFEQDGFEGFREEDDEFWDHFRVQTMAFRAGTCLTPDLVTAPKSPLDRHGEPPKYPAAAHYDFDTKTWVPTTEEQEQRLREPNPVYDPYFIPVAQPGETHTTMKPPPVKRSQDESDPIELDAQLFNNPFDKAPDLRTHRRQPLNMQPAAWRVVHLGTSSAMPTLKRNVSSTAMLVDTRAIPDTASANGAAQKPQLDTTPAMFLVDVGENTESRLMHCDWCMTHGFRWIKAIFITHLHGDHIYGLPKLLWTIGNYAQHRRRIALERGEDGSDPVIRIFGPYGTRGFVRASLHWTKPVGVRFSVSELVPRDSDFLHLSANDRRPTEPQIIVHDMATGQVSLGSGLDMQKSCPPPLEEEVRAADTTVSEDGLWHVWEEPCEDGRLVEVVAAPLKHRMPCFGYVFRERYPTTSDSESSSPAEVEVGSSGEKAKASRKKTAAKPTGEEIEIDKEKAKALGVYGSQFRVLRSGRSVKISKTGQIVTPEEVCVEKPVEEEIEVAVDSNDDMTEPKHSDIMERRKRVVTLLGDTCDSSEIAAAAEDSELLVHEATFAGYQANKARIAMHSTAFMAGAFGRRINAKKVALTHFSSRYEAMLQDDLENGAKNTRGAGSRAGNNKRGGFVFVDEEDEDMLMESEETSESDLMDGRFEELTVSKTGGTQLGDDLLFENGDASEEDDSGEDVFGVFTPLKQGRSGTEGDGFVDVLDEFDQVIHSSSEGDDAGRKADKSARNTNDEEEDEDYVSVNILVQEAYDGYGYGGRDDVEIVAAYDFLEHDIAVPAAVPAPVK